MLGLAMMHVHGLQALQAAIGESIADRQLQQELDRQGYSMVQLDAMFADEGVFSTETEVVSAETADPVQVSCALHAANHVN